MTTSTGRREGVFSSTYAATSVGMVSLIAFVAFEAMAVATVMPTVARDLAGVALFALAFAAPLASGVVGMVAAGMWSDRRGPAVPLVVSMVLFSLGLVICGLAPTMEILVAGRVVQGLGGGALIVGVYVVVGLVFPPRLQPSIFAAFAAAWVLPALFGPALAAFISHAVGWRWVFLGAVVLVVLAALLVAPALRRPVETTPGTPAPRSRLLWAVVGAAAVLAFELLGSGDAVAVALAAVAFVLVLLALRRLLPVGTLSSRRGLPAVIATRGLISAAFFCGEAYIVFVLQEQWGISAGGAGIALTCVGIVWAGASQLQARLGERVSDATAIHTGSSLVLLGLVCLALVVWLDVSPVLAGASYVFAGAGMGFAYPRLSVSMLAASTVADRGFNSSALSIADSLGAALALSISGVAFTIAGRNGLDPFVVVFALAVLVGVLAVFTAGRVAVAQQQPAA